jgi:hypothetical protein
LKDNLILSNSARHVNDGGEAYDAELSLIYSYHDETGDVLPCKMNLEKAGIPIPKNTLRM